MGRHNTALLVVDVQDRLLSVMPSKGELVKQCRLLVQAAGILKVPTLATEQYPKGLGRTESSLAELLDAPLEKTSFSCCGCPEVGKRLETLRTRNVLIAGMEAHVCVQQTALDLVDQGFHVHVAVDAVRSRRDEDRHWAMQRMTQQGVLPTTTEAAIFEWTESSQAPEFKQISQLIKSASAD